MATRFNYCIQFVGTVDASSAARVVNHLKANGPTRNVFMQPGRPDYDVDVVDIFAACPDSEQWRFIELLEEAL